MRRTKLLLTGMVSMSLVIAAVYALNIYSNKNNNISYYTSNQLTNNSKLLNCNDKNDSLELRIIDNKSIVINGVLSNIEKITNYNSKNINPSVCGLTKLYNGKLVETGQYYFYMSKDNGYLYITDIVNKATKDSLGGAWKIKLS